MKKIFLYILCTYIFSLYPNVGKVEIMKEFTRGALIGSLPFCANEGINDREELLEKEEEDVAPKRKGLGLGYLASSSAWGATYLWGISSLIDGSLPCLCLPLAICGTFDMVNRVDTGLNLLVLQKKFKST